jgi:hypothetical protein
VASFEHAEEVAHLDVQRSLLEVVALLDPLTARRLLLIVAGVCILLAGAMSSRSSRA